MLKVHNPLSIAAPIGTYSHGIEVPPGARWLHVAGQIGVRPKNRPKWYGRTFSRCWPTPAWESATW